MRGFEGFVLGYLVNSLWQVPLICVAGYACARQMRRIGPQAEHWIWVAALLIAAILPAGGAVRMPQGFGSGASANGTTSVQVVMGRFAQSASTALHLPLWLRHGAVIAYLGLMLFFCVRLVWGLVQSDRLRRGAQRLALTEEWQTVWESYCRVFDVRGAEIASTPMAAGPLTVGFRRRMLLVSPDFMETTEARDAKAALGHELAHMRRQDFLKNALYELVLLPVSYHPMTRWLKAQVRQSRELVCDSMAAELMATREHYARSLLRLASLMSKQTPPVNIHAIGIFDANILERRVMNLMTKPRETTWLQRAVLVMACVAVGIVTCNSALALRLDVNEPPPPAAASTAGGHAGEGSNFVRVKLIYKKNPVYPAQAKADKNTVNGVCVVAMTIGEDGVPTNVHVVKSLRADYDESAVEAVRDWRFTPALKDGRPVAVESNVQIDFQMK